MLSSGISTAASPPPAVGRGQGHSSAGTPVCQDVLVYGGCTGMGTQECYFFHLSLHQGSKSALKKAFIFPSTLPAAVPAIPCSGQDAAVLAHIPRAHSRDRIHPRPARLVTCHAKGSSHITSQLPCTPSLGTGSLQGALALLQRLASTPHSPPVSLPLPSPLCWKRSHSPVEGCQGGTG